MDENLRTLERMNARSTMYSKSSERSFRAATVEINKASAGDESSRFTKRQVQIFYKATQPAWQNEDISLQDRNMAIMEYYGRDNLAEFVEEITELNIISLKAGEVQPEEEMTEEQEERYRNEPDVEHDLRSPSVSEQTEKILEQMADYIVSPERR